MIDARFPSSVEWMRSDPVGAEWLARLPRRLAECVDRWTLRVGEPYDGSYVSVVWPVTRPDGSEAVLKIQYPDAAATHEASALRLWDGQAAIRLLDHDPQHRALLLERCDPGTPLSRRPADEALVTLTDLIGRLWRPAAAPFATAEQESLRWAGELGDRWRAAGRPCPRELVDAAIGVLGELATSQGESVLLNQDLHVNNVLAARREPWLVIDPKPLVGEPELAVAAVVRDYGLGHARAQVHGRLAHVSAALGVDLARSRAWSFAYAVVWAFLEEGEGQTRHLETASWLRAGI